MSPAGGPDWRGLAIAAVPVVALGAVLAARRLGQVRALAVSVARMTGQLLLLGVVLGWVFAHQGPLLVGAAALVMLLASAQTVGARQGPSGRRSAQVEGFVALAVSVAVVAALSVRLALRVEPWYEARTLIPLLGMILGNSVNGVALAAERLDAELRQGRDLVELRLALGASARQAAAPALRAAVGAGLTPILNSMAIAGVVAIPGMTTGQLLAGADVYAALRYQILIYLGITATAGFSILGLLGLRLRRYFTAADQLRADRLG